MILESEKSVLLRGGPDVILLAHRPKILNSCPCCENLNHFLRLNITATFCVVIIPWPDKKKGTLFIFPIEKHLMCVESILHRRIIESLWYQHKKWFVSIVHLTQFPRNMLTSLSNSPVSVERHACWVERVLQMRVGRAKWRVGRAHSPLDQLVEKISESVGSCYIFHKVMLGTDAVQWSWAMWYYRKSRCDFWCQW